jgi:peptidoglycan/LPS O-acetylase OafA/YrhL
MITIAERDAGRSNNFDIIRFVAASMVVLSHSYALLLDKASEPLAALYPNLDLGGLAVDIFFVTSGYLITKSMLRRRSALGYLEARFLRIMPGLVATGIFSALLIGPVVAPQGPLAYLSNSDPWVYFLYNTFTVYTSASKHLHIQGLFDNAPIHGINGSLWTLGGEIELYGVIFILGMGVMLVRHDVLRRLLPAMVRRQAIGRRLLALARHEAVERWLLIAAFASILTICMWRGRLNVDFNAGNIYRLAAFFMCGSLVYMFRERIRISAWVAVGLLGVFVLLAYTPVAGLAFYLAITYAVFTLAFHPKLRAWSFGKRGDYSYGIYIYAFPIQQVLITSFGVNKPLLVFAAAYPLTVGVAMLSWYFMEEPALRAKGRLFRRRPPAEAQAAAEGMPNATW